MTALSPKPNRPKVALILYPNFNPIVLVPPQTVFMAEIDGVPLFECKTVAESEQAVGFGGKIAISADENLAWLDQADVIVIAGWAELDTPPSPALCEALQRNYLRGATVVGLC